MKRKRLLLVTSVAALAVAIPVSMLTVGNANAETTPAQPTQTTNTRVQPPPAPPTVVRIPQNAPAISSKQKAIDAENAKQGLPKGCSEVFKPNKKITCMEPAKSEAPTPTVAGVVPHHLDMPPLCNSAGNQMGVWATRSDNCGRYKWYVHMFVNRKKMGSFTITAYQHSYTLRGEKNWMVDNWFLFRDFQGIAVGGGLISVFNYSRGAGYDTITNPAGVPVQYGPASNDFKQTVKMLPRINGRNQFNSSDLRVQFGLLPFASETPVMGNVQTIPMRCDTMLSFRIPGCVVPEFVPTFQLSVSNSKVSESAWFIWDTQYQGADHWGWYGKGQALSRTTDVKQINKNRRTACPASRKRPKGKSCDEFPFASSRQGAGFVGTKRAKSRMINAKHNSAAGTLIGSFYRSQRVFNHDRFWVSITR